MISVRDASLTVVGAESTLATIDRCSRRFEKIRTIFDQIVQTCCLNPLQHTMAEISPERLESDVVAAQLLQMRLELTGFVRALVGDVHTADDVFQETCVKAVREAGAGGFFGAEHVRRWAFVTAKNAAIDLLRHRSGKRGEVALSEDVLELLANDQAESTDSSAASGRTGVG